MMDEDARQLKWAIESGERGAIGPLRDRLMELGFDQIGGTQAEGRLWVVLEALEDYQEGKYTTKLLRPAVKWLNGFWFDMHEMTVAFSWMAIDYEGFGILDIHRFPVQPHSATHYVKGYLVIGKERWHSEKEYRERRSRERRQRTDRQILASEPTFRELSSISREIKS